MALSPGNHGVIVIHGIGDNMTPGSLLADVTNSLADALIESPEKGVKAKIRREADLSRNPPSVTLYITSPSKDYATWICKEAFWDDAIPPPKASTVLWKLLGKNIIKHIEFFWNGWKDPGNSEYKDKESDERFHFHVKTLKDIDIKNLKGIDKDQIESIAASTYIKGNSATTPFWILPLAGVAYLVLAFLWICQFLPSIGPLEKVLKWVRKLDPFITNSFGDVHKYMEHEVWRANARGRLEDIIINMLKKNEEPEKIEDITIIAHSMGCVVTYDALAEGGKVAMEIKKIKETNKDKPEWKQKKITFVSVGSAINQVFKLYAKEQFKRRHLAEEITGSDSGKTPGLRKEQFHWLDIWARRDPIPAGHLDIAVIEKAEVIPEQFKGRRIINMDSIFLDHSAYWSNHDDCIPRIAEAINTDEPLWDAAGITPKKLEQRIKYASRFRLLTLKLLAQTVVSAIVVGGVVFLILQWTGVL